jgi:invasion protein IalB
MRTKTAALTLILALTSTAVAAAAQPTRIKQFDAWGVYSYQNGGKTSCYALTVPVSSAPASVNHGDNFFLIAPQGQALMPQAIMGYGLKPGSEIALAVGDEQFRLTPKENTAWVSNQEREPALIDAMRGGSRMTVRAVSGRGTNTTYSYSLSGVTAALQEVRGCR